MHAIMLKTSMRIISGLLQAHTLHRIKFPSTSLLCMFLALTSLLNHQCDAIRLTAKTSDVDLALPPEYGYSLLFPPFSMPDNSPIANPLTPPVCVFPPSIPSPPTSTYNPSPPPPPFYFNPVISIPPPPPPPMILSPPIVLPKPPASPTYAPNPPQTVPSPPNFSPVYQPPVVFPPPAVPPPPPSTTSGLWCVAKPAVPDPIIQEAMNYACGSGAECDSIQETGPCYSPNTVLNHASFAFNSYWQRTKVAGGTCDFGGTAMLITVDPSYDGCRFPYGV